MTLGDEDALFKNELDVSDLVFQKRVIPDGENVRLFAKIRYAAKPVMCTVTVSEGKAHVVLDEQARAVTPGQSAVFYDENDIVFGGFID